MYLIVCRVLPPSKKTRTSSDEGDTEAAEKKVDAEAVVEDVDSRKAKARTFSDKVDTETADQNVDVDEVGVEADSKKVVNEIDEEGIFLLPYFCLSFLFDVSFVLASVAQMRLCIVE